MAVIYQGLVKWGTLVIPVRDIQFAPNVATAVDQSSGDTSPTAVSILGASPGMTATLPAKIAMATFGAENGAATALEMSLLKVDPATGKPAAGATNIILSLQASCLAYGMINTIDVAQRGHAQAACSIALVSNDGDTNPIGKADGAALSLAANPDLLTMGPVTINGSEVDGAQSFSVNFSHDMDLNVSDGDKFPTHFGHHSVSTSIDIQHGDPDAVLDAVGLGGSAIASATSVKMFDVASGVVAGTGTSITIANGAVESRPAGGGVQGRATGGIGIMAAAVPTFGTF